MSRECLDGAEEGRRGHTLGPPESRGYSVVVVLLCLAKVADVAKLPWCYIFSFLSACSQPPMEQPAQPPAEEAVVAEDESTTVMSEPEAQPEAKPQDAEPLPVEAADKEDVVATTSAPAGEPLRPEDNLVVDYPATADGSCAVDGVLFVNGSGIPPANPCQTSCRCESGVVYCYMENCAPPPAHMSRCMPVHHDGVCCPTYACG